MEKASPSWDGFFSEAPIWSRKCHLEQATASAEGFAAGSVSLLDGLGVCRWAMFSEVNAEIQGTLMNIAQILVKEQIWIPNSFSRIFVPGMKFSCCKKKAMIRYMRAFPCTPAFRRFIRTYWTFILSSPKNIAESNTAKRFSVLTEKTSSCKKRKGSGYHDTDFLFLSDEKNFPLLPASGALFWNSKNIAVCWSFPVDPFCLPYGFLNYLKKTLSDSVLDSYLHYKLLLEYRKALKCIRSFRMHWSGVSWNPEINMKVFLQFFENTGYYLPQLCPGSLLTKIKAPGHIPLCPGILLSNKVLRQTDPEKPSILLSPKPPMHLRSSMKLGFRFYETCAASNLTKCFATNRSAFHPRWKSLRII